GGQLVRLPQPRQLPGWSRRNPSRAGAGRGSGNPGLRRARRRVRQALRLLLPPRAAQDRHAYLRRARPVLVPAGVGRALSRARRNAGAHGARRLPRSELDAVHVRDRGPSPRDEVELFTRRAQKTHQGHRPTPFVVPLCPLWETLLVHVAKAVAVAAAGSRRTLSRTASSTV